MYVYCRVDVQIVNGLVLNNNYEKKEIFYMSVIEFTCLSQSTYLTLFTDYIKT